METNPPTFTPRDTWPPGTVVKDDYVIEARIGKGGFGTVYKAKHRFLQSDHVIKRLHEEYSSDEEYVRKFIAEGQVIRRLKECLFVVAVEHMTLTADEHLILIMEFMPGGDLNKLMEERRFFTIEEVAGYSVQIGEGLRAAHAIELIHRDVKPHNVLLGANKRKAKLTDFGIAADHQNSKATSVVRGGSLGFAAPEQWTTSGRNLDGRTDIYSLGVTMYQMLTGCMPYAAADIGGWIEAVRTTAPVHVNKLREDTPEDINRLVMQMIEVRREHRPPNVETVLEALRPYASSADWGRSMTIRVPDRALIDRYGDPTAHAAPATPATSGQTSSNPPAFSPSGPPPPPPPQQTFSPGVPPPPPPPPPPQFQPHPSQPGYTPTQFQPAQNFASPPPTPQSQYPVQPQFASSLPQYDHPAMQQPPPPPMYQQPVNQQQPPPPQWTPQQPPPPVKKNGGGAGKWLVIGPLVLALAGGGGWYGWKMYHPQPSITTEDDSGAKKKDNPGPATGAKPDWIAKGDEAQKAGEYHLAVKYFRKAPDSESASRLQTLQPLVEARAEREVDRFSDNGQFDEAEATVDKWSQDYPESEKLKALKEKVHRRRASQ